MSRSFSISVPAEPAQLVVVRAFFKSVLGDALGSACEDVVLAVDECCSNVVKHRSPTAGTNLDVTAELHDDLVRFRIASFCLGKDVDSIHPRDLKDVRPGGLGTHFVKQIMDEVSFEPSRASSTCVDLILEKKIPVEAS